MAVVTTPPVVIQPDMQEAQKAAFINQNFQNIASVLSTNSFKIVKSDTLVGSSYTSSNPGAGNFGRSTTTLATAQHNLGFVPALLAYLSDGSGNYTLLPSSQYSAPAGNQAHWLTFGATVDLTSVYFIVDIINYGNSASLSGFQMKYFLLQETAN